MAGDWTHFLHIIQSFRYKDYHFSIYVKQHEIARASWYFTWRLEVGWQRSRQRRQAGPEQQKTLSLEPLGALLRYY